MASKKMGKGTPDFIVTPGGRIQSPVRAFGGGVTGTPPMVEEYSNSDPPGTNKLALRRPTGGETGAGINTIAKGGKGSKGR